MATGLMIIAIDGATKQLDQFLKLPKSYEAEILLGTKTDSGDLEGEVVDEREIYDIDPGYIREIVENFTGTFELAVPKYSAVKRKGKPLYEYARKGEDVEVPIKSMEVFKTEFVSLKEEDNKFILKVKFDVASGVYIRSLVEYLAEALDTVATLKNLRRTKIGKFDLRGAKKLDLQGFSRKKNS
jgi:tRNA pseudouridine55 synthase